MLNARARQLRKSKRIDQKNKLRHVFINKECGNRPLKTSILKEVWQNKCALFEFQSLCYEFPRQQSLIVVRVHVLHVHVWLPVCTVSDMQCWSVI